MIDATTVSMQELGHDGLDRAGHVGLAGWNRDRGDPAGLPVAVDHRSWVAGPPVDDHGVWQPLLGWTGDLS